MINQDVRKPLPARRSAAMLMGMVIATILTGCGGPGGVRGAATDHPCEDEVNAALAATGVQVDDMTGVLWASYITGTGVDRTLIGYHFQGRPPSCEQGDVTASFWPNCGIQQIRTRGDCTLPGL